MPWISRSITRPEALIYIALGFFATAFLLLNAFSNSTDDSGLLGHYMRLGGAKLLGLLVLAAVGLMVVAVVRTLIFLTKAGLRNVTLYTLFSVQNLASLRSGLRKFTRDMVFIGLPFSLAFYAFLLALEQLNMWNRSRLMDDLVAHWDLLLTHTFPSLWLASYSYPQPLIQAVTVCFDLLVPIFIIFGIYLFQARQKIFREASGVFFGSMMIMFVGWALLPVMSPHDRYIDNVYGLPVAPRLQGYLHGYHPQKEITNFLEDMRKSKSELSIMPTSTLPSAHVAWAIIFVFYARRVSRWCSLLVLPLALLSTMGTVLLAQHYFIDVLAGAAVGMGSIAAVGLFGKVRRRIESRASVQSQKEDSFVEGMNGFPIRVPYAALESR